MTSERSSVGLWSDEQKGGGRVLTQDSEDLVKYDSPGPVEPQKAVQFSSVAQSCATLCDPMNRSTPGLPVHGVFQARVLEWIAISFSRGSS